MHHLPPEPPGWRLEPVTLDHPDAERLVAQVQRFYESRYGTPDSAPIEVEELRPPTGELYVGYLGEEPVATGAWRRTAAGFEDVEPVVEIKRMFVTPAVQRRGLSRLVLAHLEDTAVRAGARAAVLETGARQPEAIALYVSCGYQPIPGYGWYRDSPLSRCFGKRLG